MIHAINSLPAALRTLLCEEEVVACYGFGCELHIDLLWKPMRVRTNWIERFIRDSLKQGIVIPCGSDFEITVPDNRLSIQFCHECDIHLGGADGDLMQQLLGLPPFSEMKFERESGA